MEFKSRRAEKYGSDPITLNCNCDPSQGTVILFYAYLPIDDPLTLAKLHKTWSIDLGLFGKVKLATEGINATVAGSPASITAYINNLTSLPEFESLNLSQACAGSEADLEKRRYNFFKPTSGCRHVFGEHISIKVVEEICPLGAPELSVYHDPENKRGKLSPRDFHQKLKELGGKEDVVVLDVRNYYESTIGRFPGAVTPPIRKFSSFRDYVDRNKDQFSGKTILSYCTGGIRCEKATSYLRQSLEAGGDSQPAKVLMLDGGIHNYLEWVKHEGSAKESLWLGKNYVFDARQSLGLEDVSVTEGASPDDGDRLISACQGCNASCARYVKCDGFGCHRLIISCVKCSPLTSGGESGMFCCEECRDMGERVQQYVLSGQESAPVFCIAYKDCHFTTTNFGQVGIDISTSSINYETKLWALIIYSMSNASESQWLFRKEDLYRTPSLMSGLSYQFEKESRSKGVTFIIQVGMHLKLPQLTMATAALFFHRFYMRHSLKDYKFYDIGATCIYLASKTEESTRKFKDVIIACAQKAAKKEIQIDDSSKEFRVWKDTIIYTEEILLEALCFELSVEHPYQFMLSLFNSHYADAQRARKLKQVAWAFINDSLRTTLCLLYPPKIIALAAIHIAAKYLEENLNEGLGDIWRELFEPDVQDITDAANEIMDQYTQFPNKSGRSLDKMLPGSKPGSEYQENGTPSYGGYLNSPAKLATPVYNVETDRPSNGDRSVAP
ncbi:hypothetical protein BGX21_003033 [Mortierella sp. AD011]|nr:hypothetical protein BGX21_003033 [Mortierella sp. AD011]